MKPLTAFLSFCIFTLLSCDPSRVDECNEVLTRSESRVRELESELTEKDKLIQRLKRELNGGYTGVSLSDSDAKRDLKVSYDAHRRLLGRNFLIQGIVKNTSDKFNYKHIELSLTYYSENKDRLGSKTYVISETIEFGLSTGLDLELDTPKGTKTVSIEIVDAIPEIAVMPANGVG